MLRPPLEEELRLPDRRAVQRVVVPRQQHDGDRDQAQRLDRPRDGAPLDRVRLEVLHMGEHVLAMLRRVLPAVVA